MRFPLLLLIVIAACGTPHAGAPDADVTICPVVTVYQGQEHDCDRGKGVCVDRGFGDGVQCIAKCATDGPVCDTDHRWETIATNVGHVCYCALPGSP